MHWSRISDQTNKYVDTHIISVLQLDQTIKCNESSYLFLCRSLYKNKTRKYFSQNETASIKKGSFSVTYFFWGHCLEMFSSACLVQCPRVPLQAFIEFSIQETLTLSGLHCFPALVWGSGIIMLKNKNISQSEGMHTSHIIQTVTPKPLAEMKPHTTSKSIYIDIYLYIY